MGHRIKYFILLGIILFCFRFYGWGQGVYGSVIYFEKTVTAKSQPPNTYGYRIFKTLAQDNVININNIYFNIEGKILIKHSVNSNGRQVAFLKFVSLHLTGETKYRNFEIDSVLIPAAFKGTLALEDQDRKRVELPLEMLLSGGVLDLGGINPRTDDKGALIAEIRINRFMYTKYKYNKFRKTTNLINNYYAYGQVLKRLVSKFYKNGINRNQYPSDLFLAWHEITRADSYIKSYNFSDRLSLNLHDPEGFLVRYERLKRFKKRATTLRNQEIASKKYTSSDDKKQFVLKLSGLSAAYSNLEGNFQPYLSTGFGQMVRLYSNHKELDAIKEEAAYYDVSRQSEQASTSQLIYNNFIQLANLTYKNGKYVSALDFIYDAKVMEDYFPGIERSDDFDNLYSKTLDGVLRSYLEVAVVAYKKGSYLMADRYYRKAEEAYDYYRKLQYGSKMPTDAFLMFIEQQVEISYELLASKKYYEAVKLLDNASDISTSKQIITDSLSIKSAYSIGYSGIYHMKLDSLAMRMDKDNPDSALSALNEVYDFSVDHSSYLKGNGDQRFVEMARVFYDFYFDRGRQLMNSPKQDEALDDLLEAKSINEKYIHDEISGLDSLIDDATVPVILVLAKKAGFEVWANRVDNARQLYGQIQQMQIKYHQQDNEILNMALADLHQRIENRTCISVSNECFALEKQVENRIKYKNFSEAQQLLAKADTLIRQNKRCDIDPSGFDAVKQKYQTVFKYIDLRKEAEKSFGLGRYNLALQQYQGAKNFYSSHALSRYGVQQVSIKSVVKSAKNASFTKSACRYALTLQDYKSAFYFLTLLKDQNVPPKTVKDLQQSIGNALARNDMNYEKNPKEIVQQYTGGEKWYRYFRVAYLQY